MHACAVCVQVCINSFSTRFFFLVRREEMPRRITKYCSWKLVKSLVELYLSSTRKINSLSSRAIAFVLLLLLFHLNFVRFGSVIPQSIACVKRDNENRLGLNTTQVASMPYKRKTTSDAGALSLGTISDPGAVLLLFLLFLLLIIHT